MGRPRTGTHSVPTPTRILDAAESAFGASAYAQARLADIARDAGVRRPSLLYHFSSKEALHGAVVDRLFADLMTRFGDVSAVTGDPAETVDSLFSAWVGFVDERPAFASIVLRGMIDGHGTVRGHLEQRLVPLLDHVEAGLRHAGVAPSRLPVRGALLQIGSDSLVRAASGPLRERLWGLEDPMVGVRRLFELPPA